MIIDLMGYTDFGKASESGHVKKNEDCWCVEFYSRQQMIESVSDKCSYLQKFRYAFPTMDEPYSGSKEVIVMTNNRLEKNSFNGINNIKRGFKMYIYKKNKKGSKKINTRDREADYVRFELDLLTLLL